LRPPPPPNVIVHSPHFLRRCSIGRCCQLYYQDFSADWRKKSSSTGKKRYLLVIYTTFPYIICVVQILISKSTSSRIDKLRKPSLHKVFFVNLLENPPKIPLYIVKAFHFYRLFYVIRRKFLPVGKTVL
jgi:hypothetical protein